MNSALTTKPGTDFGVRLKAFLSWWGGELWEMVPGFLKQAAYPDEDLLLVFFQGDDATFFERESSGWKQLSKSSAHSNLAEIRSLIPGLSLEKKTRIARIAPEEVLQHVIELPLTAERELERIISYQLDTLSPYPTNRIYHAYRILGRDLDRAVLQVELYLVPKEQVDAVTARMREWNITPDFVDCASEEASFDPAINFLSTPTGNTANKRRLSRFNTLLVLVNILLLVALAFTHLLQKKQAEEELSLLVETAKVEAEAANDLRSKVNELQQQGAFLQDLKNQRVPALQVIDELTKIIPDDTWIEGALYHGDQLNLSGISAKSSTLISTIERSPLFQDVAFQASVVQDFRSGGERFQIRAKITAPTEDAE